MSVRAWREVCAYRPESVPVPVPVCRLGSLRELHLGALLSAEATEQLRVGVAAPLR